MTRWFLCSLVALVAVQGFGQEGFYRDSKSVSKTFAVKSTTHFEVDNKYGNIFFETWDKDSIRIDVEVVAQSKKQEYVSELMSLAVIDLHASGSFVVARTNWGKHSSLWSQTKNEIRNVFGSDQKVEITYRISLPDDMSLDVTNKFGDVYLPAYKGSLTIDLSHGDLRCRKIEKPRNVKMSYGTLRVDEWGSGNINLVFAEMYARETARLKIVSRSSKFYIDKAERLDFDSKNDELHIKEIKELNGNLHFTTSDIDLLTGRVDLTQNYGSLNIDLLKETFNTVRIKPKKSDVSIKIPESVSFDFSVYLTNGLEFSSVPQLLTITRDEDVGAERQIEGYWKAKNSSRTITIHGESSQIRLAKH